MTSPSIEQRASWRLAALIVVAVAALLAVGTLGGMNVDEDEFATSVLMTTLQAHAAWRGDLPFWSSSPAFGLPLSVSAPSWRWKASRSRTVFRRQLVHADWPAAAS